MAQTAEVTGPKVMEDSKQQQPHTKKYQLLNIVIHLLGLITSSMMWPIWAHSKDSSHDLRDAIPIFAVMYLVSCFVVAALIMDDFKWLEFSFAKYRKNMKTEPKVKEVKLQQPHIMDGTCATDLCAILSILVIFLFIYFVPSVVMLSISCFDQKILIYGAIAIMGLLCTWILIVQCVTICIYVIDIRCTHQEEDARFHLV